MIANEYQAAMLETGDQGSALVTMERTAVDDTGRRGGNRPPRVPRGFLQL